MVRREPVQPRSCAGELKTNRDDVPEAVCQCPDGELVRRMQADDLEAFESLFHRHRAAIYRAAYALVGDTHAAEEVLQDTFDRAWRRRSILRTDISPLPWLHRVALNLCYTRLGRRRLPAEPIGDDVRQSVPDGEIEPELRAERRELRQIVREQVSVLPAKHRTVVVLYYLNGLSLQETADVLGIRVGTVKSRLHYALRMLRGELERDRRFGGAYRPVPGDPVPATAEADVE